MKKYVVATPEKLRRTCIEQNWFTYGTNSQYEKLFYANEMGCPIEEIATLIWRCSDDEMWNEEDILFKLKKLQDNSLLIGEIQ